MAVSTNDLMDFECSESFVISFTAELECTFELAEKDPRTVGYGSNKFTKEFDFARGANTAGDYKEYVQYTVTQADGREVVTVNQSPAGVHYLGTFLNVPSHTAGVRQLQRHGYQVSITIDEPDPGAGVSGFTGTALSVDVTIGYDPK